VTSPSGTSAGIDASAANGSANYTLVPINRTLVDGNDHPTDGGTPSSVVYDAATGLVYTADGEFNSVSVVDPASGLVESTIPLGACPGCLGEDIVLDPSNGNLYVSSWSGGLGWVNVLDPTLGRVVDTVELPAASAIPYAPDVPTPNGVYDPSNGLLYFTAGTSVDAFSPDLSNATASIPVVPGNVTGGTCVALAYDPGDGALFVTATNSTPPPYPTNGSSVNGTYNVVAQIDPQGGSVVATVPVGPYPDGIAYDPVTAELVVSNGASANVTVLATTALSGITFAPVATVAVGGIPVGMVYDPANARVYVANLGSGSIQAFDGSNDSIVGTVDRIAYPMELDVDPVGGRLFVVDQRFLTEVNLTSGLASALLPLGEYPNGLAVAPVLGQLYDSSGAGFDQGYSEEVYGVDATNLTVAASTNFSAPFNPVPAPPSPLPYFSYAVEPIVDRAGGTLWVVGADRSVEVLSVPLLHFVRALGPGAVESGAYDPQDGDVYLAGPGDNLTVVNGTTYAVSAPIFLGNLTDQAMALAVDPSRGLVYVLVDTPSGTTNITMVATSTGSVVGNLSFGAYFVGVAVDTATGALLLTDPITDALYEYSGKPLPNLRHVLVGSKPTAVLYDTGDNEAFVANSGSNNLTALNASTLAPVRSVGLGSAPDSLALDLTTGYLYVGTSSPSSSIAAVSVGPNPLGIGSFRVLPSPAVVGSPMTVSVTAVGGVAPLTGTFSGLPPGCVGGNYPSFRCTPGAAGRFPLTVTVLDAKGATAAAAFVLTIGFPPAPVIASFAATPDPALVGGSVLLTTQVKGGAAPLTYAYSGLPPTSSTCPDLDAGLLACIPTRAGNYSVQVTVTDWYGRRANATLLLTVGCVGTPPGPEVCGFSAGPDPVGIGERTVLNVSAIGGTAPVAYAYGGLPPDAIACPNSDAPSVTCVPMIAGSYTLDVTVTDSAGRTVNASTPLVVGCQGPVPFPSICSFVASPDPVVVGALTTLSASALGGNGSLSYAYLGIPTGWSGCPSENASSLSCLPASSGSFPLTVSARDTIGGSASAQLPLTVACAGGPPGPSICAAQASPGSLSVGQSLTILVSASGGTGALSYAFMGLPPGCSSSSTASLGCHPDASGDYLVEVRVTDASGRSAEANVSVAVLGSGGPPISSPTPSWEVASAIALAALAGILIAYAVLRRRSRLSDRSSTGGSGSGPPAGAFMGGSGPAPAPATVSPGMPVDAEGPTTGPAPGDASSGGSTQR
jgi:DNA-binding beta-propeller fold protein YncE